MMAYSWVEWLFCLMRITLDLPSTFKNVYVYMQDFPSGSVGKESACKAGDPVWSLGWEDPLGPWRRNWQPTPVLFAGELRGQRSWAGYSLWDRRESDMIATFTSTRVYAGQSCVCRMFGNIPPLHLPTVPPELWQSAFPRSLGVLHWNQFMGLKKQDGLWSM